MTQNEGREMQALDALLDEVRREQQVAPSALTERVLMQANQFQPAPSRVNRRKHSFAGLLDSLGGWPAFGGLAMASCVGFWIGISPPESIVDPAVLLLPIETEAYYDPAELTGFGWDMQEG